jgi:hypothetical protein
MTDQASVEQAAEVRTPFQFNTTHGTSFSGRGRTPGAPRTNEEILQQTCTGKTWLVTMLSSGQTVSMFAVEKEVRHVPIILARAERLGALQVGFLGG